MATITKERLIYTSGTFKLDDNLRECRTLYVFIDVLRKPPSAIYQNERINPPKNFLGYVSLWIGDYVAKVFPLEYESQVVLEYTNFEFQLYKTLNCSVGLLTDNIVALGAAMTPPAILLPTTPTPPSFPGCQYEWLKFKLEPLTRIKVTAVGEEAIGCDDIDFPVSIPDFPDTTPPYPPDRPLDEDPPRSDPEPGEKPGDTTPPSADDPEADTAVPGTWLLTWTIAQGGTASNNFDGTSTDVWEIQTPGRDCNLPGSSQLVRNETEIVDGAFNCNPSGFVSTLVSQVFTPF